MISSMSAGRIRIAVVALTVVGSACSHRRCHVPVALSKARCLVPLGLDRM
jgi:hypothetical protein